MGENINKFTFGYWQTRGRGHPIRMLLNYLEVDYTEKTYTFEQKQEWFEKDKQELNMDYPNLPYIIDNDGYKLSESVAILNYIPERFGRKDMLGKTLQDRGTVQQLLGLTSDFRTIVRNIYFKENWKDILESELEKPRQQLKIFDKILSKQKWLVGDYLTIVDFFFYEYFLCYKNLVQQDGDLYKNIDRFIEDFSKIPQINKFMKSSTNQNAPGFFPKSKTFIDSIQYHQQLCQKFLSGQYDI
ncbi:Thioredoxin-like fold [Pseudocohnilembus persalinus]|uniref:glutathione transferase n=1 Tax=Pseudocohnilembus persalinus TaxID=266149 RepID=A0A0V0R3V3_PSEPJ|nr:Thioredoxin-like fold [Pseudocohnilembus persalinus]|eukprot:KRX08888.1 Thioredoxin-like fold [Pseudocohnilembus persalinus]